MNSIKIANDFLMKLKVPSGSQNGVTYEFCEGGTNGKWPNTATYVVLELNQKGWRIMQLERKKCSHRLSRIILTNEAKASIPNHFNLI